MEEQESQSAVIARAFALAEKGSWAAGYLQLSEAITATYEIGTPWAVEVRSRYRAALDRYRDRFIQALRDRIAVAGGRSQYPPL